MDDKIVAMLIIGGILVCSMFTVPQEAAQLVNVGIGAIAGFAGGSVVGKKKSKEA